MKILHLEDNIDDADLVRELLTNEWEECQIKLVATKRDYGDFEMWVDWKSGP